MDNNILLFMYLSSLLNTNAIEIIPQKISSTTESSDIQPRYSSPPAHISTTILPAQLSNRNRTNISASHAKESENVKGDVKHENNATNKTVHEKVKLSIRKHSKTQNNDDANIERNANNMQLWTDLDSDVHQGNKHIQYIMSQSMNENDNKQSDSVVQSAEAIDVHASNKKLKYIESDFVDQNEKESAMQTNNFESWQDFNGYFPKGEKNINYFMSESVNEMESDKEAADIKSWPSVYSNRHPEMNSNQFIVANSNNLNKEQESDQLVYNFGSWQNLNSNFHPISNKVKYIISESANQNEKESANEAHGLESWKHLDHYFLGDKNNVKYKESHTNNLDESEDKGHYIKWWQDSSSNLRPDNGFVKYHHLPGTGQENIINGNLNYKEIKMNVDEEEVDSNIHGEYSNKEIEESIIDSLQVNENDVVVQQTNNQNIVIVEDVNERAAPVGSSSVLVDEIIANKVTENVNLATIQGSNDQIDSNSMTVEKHITSMEISDVSNWESINKPVELNMNDAQENDVTSDVISILLKRFSTFVYPQNKENMKRFWILLSKYAYRENEIDREKMIKISKLLTIFVKLDEAASAGANIDIIIDNILKGLEIEYDNDYFKANNSPDLNQKACKNISLNINIKTDSENDVMMESNEQTNQLLLKRKPNNFYMIFNKDMFLAPDSESEDIRNGNGSNTIQDTSVISDQYENVQILDSDTLYGNDDIATKFIVTPDYLGKPLPIKRLIFGNQIPINENQPDELRDGSDAFNVLTNKDKNRSYNGNIIPSDVIADPITGNSKKKYFSRIQKMLSTDMNEPLLNPLKLYETKPLSNDPENNDYIPQNSAKDIPQYQNTYYYYTSDMLNKPKIYQDQLASTHNDRPQYFDHYNTLRENESIEQDDPFEDQAILDDLLYLNDLNLGEVKPKSYVFNSDKHKLGNVINNPINNNVHNQKSDMNEYLNSPLLDNSAGHDVNNIIKLFSPDVQYKRPKIPNKHVSNDIDIAPLKMNKYFRPKNRIDNSNGNLIIDSYGRRKAFVDDIPTSINYIPRVIGHSGLQKSDDNVPDIVENIPSKIDKDNLLNFIYSLKNQPYSDELDPLKYEDPNSDLSMKMLAMKHPEILMRYIRDDKEKSKENSEDLPVLTNERSGKGDDSAPLKDGNKQFHSNKNAYENAKILPNIVLNEDTNAPSDNKPSSYERSINEPNDITDLVQKETFIDNFLLITQSSLESPEFEHDENLINRLNNNNPPVDHSNYLQFLINPNRRRNKHDSNGLIISNQIKMDPYLALYQKDPRLEIVDIQQDNYNPNNFPQNIFSPDPDLPKLLQPHKSKINKADLFKEMISPHFMNSPELVSLLNEQYRDKMINFDRPRKFLDNIFNKIKIHLKKNGLRDNEIDEILRTIKFGLPDMQNSDCAQIQYNKLVDSVHKAVEIALNKYY